MLLIDAETSPVPGLLVIDSSYTLEMIKERGTEDSVLCRDIGGFFGKVWTVHPFATLLTSEGWTPRYGRAQMHLMSDRHIFIEGTVGRFSALSRFALLNFALAQLSLFVMLWRLIRRERIAVIRAGDTMFGGPLGWVLARLSGIPLVIRIASNYERLRQEYGPIFPMLFGSVKMERAVEKFVLKRADLIAAPNEDNAEFAVEGGASPHRVTIFRYGNLIAREHLQALDERLSASETLEEFELKSGSYLLCVSRLEPVKRPLDTVHVLAAVRKAGHDVTLVLIGDGVMRKELAELATTLGILMHVKFLGNQNQTALAHLMRQAGVVLSPLTGRALTEAAFDAAPIVAYDADWQGEIIIDGETGYLVPNEDREQMAEAATRLLANRALAKTLGEAARAKAFEILGPDRLNDHERSEYRKLLKLPQPPH